MAIKAAARTILVQRSMCEGLSPKVGSCVYYCHVVPGIMLSAACAARDWALYELVQLWWFLFPVWFVRHGQIKLAVDRSKKSIQRQRPRRLCLSDALPSSRPHNCSPWPDCLTNYHRHSKRQQADVTLIVATKQIQFYEVLLLNIQFYTEDIYYFLFTYLLALELFIWRICPSCICWMLHKIYSKALTT